MNALEERGTGEWFATLVGARRLWRWCFGVYALVLFVATHWPQFRIEVPGVERPDLLLHFGAFGAWCALFMLAGFVGRFGSGAHIAGSIAIAAAYAGFDEALQGLPIVRRNCAWDDFFANLGGVAIGGAAGIFAMLVARGRWTGIVSAVFGAAVGGGAGAAAGLAVAKITGGASIGLWLCAPFVLLLAAIALMPLVRPRWWHAHYPGVALGLGAFVLAFYLSALGADGRAEMLHVGMEYYAFIALVGGLYVASAGILVDVRDRGTPWRNATLLGAGAVLSNILGTAGASVLLIRPYLRMNRGRLRPVHVVFFIIIVSNCGGCLTPVGDPPLYLGYLKGVPFFWTLQHLWPMWLTVNATLLTMFMVVDSRIPRADLDPSHQFDPQDRTPLIASSPAVLCLVLLVAGVFIDPLLARYTGLAGLPIGATFQIAMAVLAFRLARPSALRANQFSFEPVREVGFLFAGIFLTMAPVLEYLREHAPNLALRTPTRYYFSTGALSAVLDNAPTYVAFLQVALGSLSPPMPMTSAGVGALIGTEAGQRSLEAIALGAVFFGALSYIGNGPNFMVRSIVDAAFAQSGSDAAPGQRLLGTRTPSFFGYIAYALAILGPVLLLNWVVFVR